MKADQLRRALMLTFAALAVALMSACQSSKQTSSTIAALDNLITHENPRFNFSVDFPVDWPYTVDGTENYEATAEREAIPDAGIRIRVEGEEGQTISVFGQNGTWMWDASEHTTLEEFTTKSGLKGTLYTEKLEEFIQIAYVIDHNQLFKEGYNTRSLGASMLMSKEAFERNEEAIREILSSIRISKSQ